MNTGIKNCSITADEVYKIVYSASHSGAYVSYLRGKRCQTEDSFFKEISASFQFPDYYGENWDALWDCLDGDYCPIDAHIEIAGIRYLNDKFDGYGDKIKKIFEELPKEYGNEIKEMRKEVMQKETEP